MEHVHQLRVGCRRASAALRAFEPLFAEKPKSLKKWLSRIRDAAGPARDIDVLLARFAAEAEDDTVSAYACERLDFERHEVQDELVKVAAKASRGTLVDSVEAGLRALAENPEVPSIVGSRDLGQLALRVACNAFLPLAQLPNPTITELHQLRIAGKRLRYSIEIFHGAFPPELREEVYPAIVGLQDRLGLINDHATAQALFQSWLGAMPPDALAADLAVRVAAEHLQAMDLKKDFLKWWTDKRIAKLQGSLQQLVHED